MAWRPPRCWFPRHARERARPVSCAAASSTVPVPSFRMCRSSTSRIGHCTHMIVNCTQTQMSGSTEGPPEEVPPSLSEAPPTGLRSAARPSAVHHGGCECSSLNVSTVSTDDITLPKSSSGRRNLTAAKGLAWNKASASFIPTREARPGVEENVACSSKKGLSFSPGLGGTPTGTGTYYMVPAAGARYRGVRR